MTIYIRLLSDQEKSRALLIAADAIRSGLSVASVFEVAPDSFNKVPGSPFAYWATENIRDLFEKFKPFEHDGRLVRQGLSTADDFRFVRCWWEVLATTTTQATVCIEESRINTGRWIPLLKGGGSSSFVSDLDLLINYQHDGKELKAWISGYIKGAWSKYIISTELYYRRGFSWALRSSAFSPSAVPDGCIFSASRYQAFTDKRDLPWTISLLNSKITSFLLRMCSERFEHPKYVVGIVSKLPFPQPTESQRAELSRLFFEACNLKLAGFYRDEVSRYFVSPLSGDPISENGAAGLHLTAISNEIDDIASLAYGLSSNDISTIKLMMPIKGGEGLADTSDDEEEEEDDVQDSSLLNTACVLRSWAVGVAFGRFDWRLVTGERAAPAEPDPFDPLPALSPGMLPVGATPFQVHGGILVDDPGNAHDLARLVDDVLGHVGQSVPDDLRRWLQREFFAFHLQRYSKSRRKAPIYWPLTTASGSYTLWLYYPSLSSQTLYTAINDFVEPKLAQVTGDVAALRSNGGARTRDEEKRFEILETVELELIELRDTLLKIARTYQPNHDDGVQITAAPLWPLFRHKPWQKVLKDTWAKLEKGDYDWAHLAMSYWPDRVREKCKTDKSLAIAHGLESLYIEPPPKPTAKRGRKPKEA